MSDPLQDDNHEFPIEEAESIIKSAIQNTLNENNYNQKKINEWKNNIITSCLKDLQNLNTSFKYIITCIIMQKVGGALITANSCYWDANKDGLCKVPWQNNTIYCIVTIYGVSIHIDDQQDDMDM